MWTVGVTHVLIVHGNSRQGIPKELRRYLCLLKCVFDRVAVDVLAPFKPESIH